MRRNLILLAMGLIFVIGFSTGALALDRPWGWGSEKDDHTWGGEQGLGSGIPMESAGIQTGILALDILFVRLTHSTPIDIGIRPVAIITIDSQQGGTDESWSGQQSFSEVRGN